MNLRELHREALSKFKLANIEKNNGNRGLYKQLLQEAFTLEKQAAEILVDKKDVEPTRSVLFRSAANLALLCKDYDEAKRLAEIGLDGSPFTELRNELEAIIQQTLPTYSTAVDAYQPYNFEQDLTKSEEEYSYLTSLRKKAVQIKVEEESTKFGGAVVVSNVIDFLQNLDNSFRYFAEINFIKALQNVKPENVLKESRIFSKNAKLLAVDLNFRSFGISVVADEGIMDNYKDHSSEFKTMRKHLFSEFKEDVLHADYNDYDFQKKIETKYTEEERLKIYSPVLNSIANKSYKIAITTDQYTKKINTFRPLNESAKKIFKPTINGSTQKEEPKIEYVNVLVPMEVGKIGTKKINLENSLFNTANTLKLNNENFADLGFRYDFQIDINVDLASTDGKSLLTATYDSVNFDVKGDINNLKDLYEKLIKKIAEYIANRDEDNISD